MKKRILVIYFIGLLVHLGHAQSSSVLSQLENGEREAVEAIALYPKEERKIILEAATHPEILVRMNYIQKKSEESFRNLLADYNEETQKDIVNLSRYPELIDAICLDGKKKSIGQMDKLLADYPEEINEIAFQANRKHFSLLTEINSIYKQSDKEFQELMEIYPKKTQEAFKELVKLPEVVITLNEYMGMTVLLGDVYKREPAKLQEELDSLNLVLAEQKTKELNEWKQSLEENPEAMAEYEKSVEEFAQSQGYETVVTSSPQQETNVTNIYINNAWRPYSYWFGPPWWYAYDYWYPYPWWYHSGYYYGPNNVIVIVGFPSYYYMHWHLYHYHHFYHYPHFTNHVVNHYYGHRSSLTTVTSVTRQWVRDNNNTLPEDWLADDGKRIERIKEYGRFKTNYEVALSSSTEKVSPREYLKNNRKEYPNLAPVLEDKANLNYGRVEPKDKVQQVEIKRDPKPVKVEKDAKPTFQQPREKIIKEPTKQEKIDRAKNYHYESWKKSNQPVKQPREVRTPPTQSQPRPMTQPVKKTPQPKPVQKRQVQPVKQNTPVKKRK